MSVYVWTLKTERRIGVRNCAKCGKKIQIGDVVRSKPTGLNNLKTRIWHIGCFESMFIEV